MHVLNGLDFNNRITEVRHGPVEVPVHVLHHGRSFVQIKELVGAVIETLLWTPVPWFVDACHPATEFWRAENVKRRPYMVMLLRKMKITHGQYPYQNLPKVTR